MISGMIAPTPFWWAVALFVWRLCMNLRKMLLGHLEEKQVTAFESRKKRGSRIADRRYTQLIDAIDELVSDTDEILHPHLELKEAA